MLRDYLENLKKKREAEKRKENASKIAAGLTAGALFGVTAGLLLAPKSGKETRKDVAEKAGNAYKISREQFKVVREDAADKMQNLKTETKKRAENLSNKIENVKNKSKNTAEEVVEEASETVSETVKDIRDKTNKKLEKDDK